MSFTNNYSVYILWYTIYFHLQTILTNYLLQIFFLLFLEHKTRFLYHYNWQFLLELLHKHWYHLVIFAVFTFFQPRCSLTQYLNSVSHISETEMPRSSDFSLKEHLYFKLILTQCHPCDFPSCELLHLHACQLVSHHCN